LNFQKCWKKNNNDNVEPLSNDDLTLRQSLLFSGLEAISYNINRRNSNLKLFEFGKSYHKFYPALRSTNIWPYFLQETELKKVGLLRKTVWLLLFMLMLMLYSIWNSKTQNSPVYIWLFFRRDCNRRWS
jgi:phenylalanyl-tRNA synthetase beta chain